MDSLDGQLPAQPAALLRENDLLAQGQGTQGSSDAAEPAANDQDFGLSFLHMDLLLQYLKGVCQRCDDKIGLSPIQTEGWGDSDHVTRAGDDHALA